MWAAINLEQLPADLRYLNPAAFAKVPVITSAARRLARTLGRNAVRQPGLWDTDLSLSKDIAVTERVRFQIRGDLFNGFNHTNFNVVSTGITSANFGRLTSTTGPRTVQFNAPVNLLRKRIPNEHQTRWLEVGDRSSGHLASRRAAMDGLTAKNNLFAGFPATPFAKRTQSPYVVREGADRYVVFVQQAKARILPKHTDVRAKHD